MMTAVTNLELTDDESPDADKLSAAISHIGEVTVAADHIEVMHCLLSKAQSTIMTTVAMPSFLDAKYVRGISDVLGKFLRGLGAECTPETKMASIISAAKGIGTMTVTEGRPVGDSVAALATFFDANILPKIVKETEGKFEEEKQKLVGAMLQSQDDWSKDAWHEIRNEDTLTTLIDSWQGLPADYVSAMAQLLGRNLEVTSISTLTALNDLHLAGLKMKMRLLSWERPLVLQTWCEIKFSTSDSMDLRNLKRAISDIENIKEGISQAMADTHNLQGACDKANKILSEALNKFMSREDRKCKTAASLASECFPLDWLELCFPQSDIDKVDRDKVKDFINDPKIAAIGDMSSALLQYKDNLTDFLSQSGLSPEFYKKITTDDVDEDKKGAVVKLVDVICKSRQALCGAKAAKVFHYKVPKILKDNGGKPSASTNREKKRLIKAVKECIGEIGGSGFPAIVMESINTL